MLSELVKILKFSPFFHEFSVFLDFLKKIFWDISGGLGGVICIFFFLKKSKNTENWWKKGENFRILTSSESKKFKFYILDFIYEKKFGGYFLKKTPFSIFEGLLGLDWEIFLGGPNTFQGACLKPWSKKSYLREFVF